ncbi:S8 family serine peptidase [Methylocystis echinoides]|uniref:Peptidase S8/S53 domain-containing protein n=1 Tax=Methylocystis echinoides TaxID=29468 RepID=A0A9W6GQF6_9HYPH|nr:S8 family serine peptidase [Methylocystis echinoides]GLI91168.1 hypothetical protein LMG27198_01600 [Methylocystis echinoides]
MPAVIIGDIDTGLNYATNSQVWINQGEIPKGLPIKDVDGDLVITFKDLNAPYYYNAPYVRDSNGNGVIDGQDLLADTRWANGVDDDQNGYLDDLVGWNFVYGTNDATDINGHGTWIASIISQSAGPSTYIVPIQIIGNFPSGAWSQAVDYFTALAKAAKARGGGERYIATNNPYSGNVPDWSAEMTALSNAARADILFLAGAGNDPTVDNDITAKYPANLSSYRLAGADCVISVTAIDGSGAISGNFGRYAVDIAAQGGSTSAAVAYATGAVAAYALKWPGATAQQIRSTLFASAVPTAQSVGKTASGGVLDQATFLNKTPALTPTGATMLGTYKGETLTGTSDDDLFVGHPDGATGRLASNEVDTLTGGAGNDMFVVGSSYELGGRTDFAVITDFAAGDKIGVAGAVADYEVRDASARGASGAGVYRKSDGELVAIVQGKSAGQISAADFIGTR